MDPMGTKVPDFQSAHLSINVSMDPTHLFFLGREDADFARCAYHGLLFEFGEEFSCLTLFFSEKKCCCIFTTDLPHSLQVSRSGSVSKIM